MRRNYSSHNIQKLEDVLLLLVCEEKVLAVLVSVPNDPVLVSNGHDGF